MDWTLAIERNRAALARIVAMLASMAGLGMTATVPLQAGRPPLRSALPTTSPPFDGGEETPAARLGSFPLPHTVGERWSAQRSGAGEHCDAPGKGQFNPFRPTLPRHRHRAILRLLRPAESAMRRLIVVAARGLVVPPSPARNRPAKPASSLVRNGSGTGIVMPKALLPGRPRSRTVSLPLFDPLKPSCHRRRSTANGVPRISSPGFGATLSPVKLRVTPAPDDPLDATRLTLRLEALAATLDDLPGQARRLARWQANRNPGATFLAPAEGGGSEGRARPVARPGTVARAKPETERGSSTMVHNKTPSRLRRFSPLRPGWPPGWSRRPGHEVHALLADLHGLAFDALADTS